ncbi:MAG TPA: hypothetical protein VFF33_08630 [Ignavibacteriaceae bacterium]|nr:hypothetical protein [Ignavibacteriaceae bacterium]
MIKKYLLVLTLLTSIFITSCYENITDAINANEAPNTFMSLYPDSTISQQQSKIGVHWWGDDPDGLVAGYFITYDNVNWAFTTKNDSTIAFSILGTDTVYNFKVAAVDDQGNGVYDSQVVYNGTVIGHEPYTDVDNSNSYTEGEPFIDLGKIDPTPADINLPLKNTSPKISFFKDKLGITIAIPETTFTVASFAWDAEDLDGNETITKVFVALNDTSNKVQLPGNTRYLTLKAILNGNDVAECALYLGTSINQPYGVNLGGLKLNNTNKIFIWSEDIAGAKSNMLKMPEEGSLKNWFVKRPKGEILIIDDYNVADNTANFYNAIFDSLNLSNKIDVLDIGYNKTSTVSGSMLPKLLNPMFTETLKLFKYIFWYTDDIPSFEPAQTSIRFYTEAGGKVLFSMQFPTFFEASLLSDFLPIDSLYPSTIGILAKGININPLVSGFPSMQVDQSNIPVKRVRGFYPNPLTTVALYNLGTTGNPITAFRNNTNNLYFIGLPLDRLNGGEGNVKEFFEKVFIAEFGAGK